MNVTDTGGTFLHELSAVERAQPQALTISITMGPETAEVQCMTGPPVTLPYNAERFHIAQLLAQTTGTVLPPAPGDPDTYEDAPDPQLLWAELLDDLGAYLPDLSHADPRLRLVAVHREGATASIEVTSGGRDLTNIVALDSQEMPTAVTIDIARVFPSSPHAMKK